ncbi:hypothetical protein MTO96_021693 [Rhipicephalus appendiculatus]
MWTAVTTWVSQEPADHKVPKDLPEKGVLRVCADFRDLMDCLAPRAHKEIGVPKDLRERRVLQVTLEGQECQVCRVFGALREFPAFPERTVCLAKGLSEGMYILKLTLFFVVRAFPVRMENQASKACKAHKVYRGCLDYQARRVIRVRPAPKVARVHRAFKARAVTQARKGPLEPPDHLGGQERQESVVWPDLWARGAFRDCRASPASLAPMARRANKVPLGPWDHRDRMESVGREDLLVKGAELAFQGHRACVARPAHQDLLVRR